ncbi:MULTISPECIES: hypothetical protein [unclassified Lysobacter]|uniref:hypothetical protein n=1 Tax=unclassified Lysobacter TaxID=2635362 RepID=UPI001BE97104|nr:MULTISPECIES: hypothetical protein [unclassified Lysobacter]MBT2747301.1 hypothetical protein [Lysobacter sp. ISL-42]MBT2753346.1 hypothetical protein [Lysobacter sp. ISL-50]MBT2775456.1 hypothetical protein [Lysobacter sp. ISL-54]MBT2783008.1 hypothetical protein [Lysobacter sp. ISL-52]
MTAIGPPGLHFSLTQDEADPGQWRLHVSPEPQAKGHSAAPSLREWWQLGGGAAEELPAYVQNPADLAADPDLVRALSRHLLDSLQRKLLQARQAAGARVMIQLDGELAETAVFRKALAAPSFRPLAPPLGSPGADLSLPLNLLLMLCADSREDQHDKTKGDLGASWSHGDAREDSREDGDGDR